MDVSFLCSSTTPATVPAKSAGAAIEEKKQQEDHTNRRPHHDVNAVAEPCAGNRSGEGVRDKPGSKPETYTAGNFPAAPSKTAESAPAARLCPPQMPPRSERLDFAPLPFPSAQVLREDHPSRDEFGSSVADSEPPEQWHPRGYGSDQLARLEGWALASGEPAVGVAFQPKAAKLRDRWKLCEDLSPTFPPVQPYAYGHGAGVYGPPHDGSATDVRLCVPQVPQEAAFLYPYTHGHPHHPCYPPFSSPVIYYGSLPTYRAGNAPFVAFGAEKYAHPVRRPSLPPAAALVADFDRIYENCTVIARFAVGMSDEACQISTRPLPPLDEFEVRDLILRAHDVLRTLAALGGYPAPVVPTANPCAADSDGGTARHTKGEGAVSAGTAAERDKQSKPKYRKRRKGGNAGGTGSCHSCNVSETPEWRRGPDGARTLCNACGLHFAKLRRKQALSEMVGLEEAKLITTAATNPFPRASELPSACSTSAAPDDGGDKARTDTSMRQSVLTSSLSSACTLSAEKKLNLARGGDGLLDKGVFAGLFSSCKAENVSVTVAPDQTSAESATSAAAGDGDPERPAVPARTARAGHPTKATYTDGCLAIPQCSTPFSD